MLATTGAVYWGANLATGHPVLPPDVPAEAWPGIVGVGVVAGFIAVQAFYAGAQRVGAAQASLISTVEPLWTIVAAGLLFGERLQPMQLAGGVLILGGVLLAQTGRPRPAGARAASASDDAAAIESALPQPIVHLGEE
jgi:drug/metabolite transporter (DMT)-like permease